MQVLLRPEERGGEEGRGGREGRRGHSRALLQDSFIPQTSQSKQMHPECTAAGLQ